MDWGDVPGWFSAVGTVGALAVALTIFRQSVSDRRQEQARKVSAWSGAVVVTPDGYHVRVPFQVRNLSDELITDVSARLVTLDDKDIGPAPHDWKYADLEPGGTAGFTLEERLDLGWSGVDAARVRVVFTDAAGRRWRRVGGQLRRVSGAS
ncbi:hypothetical protein [Blastococcus sp. SYSU D00813]